MKVKGFLELVVIDEGLHCVGCKKEEGCEKHDYAKDAKKDHSAADDACPCNRLAALVISVDDAQGDCAVDHCQQTGDKTCRVANEAGKGNRHPTSAKEEDGEYAQC